KLAFDQAAHLYRLTLEALPPKSLEARKVRVRLAEMLGWAGRGAESASVYLEAARDASAKESAALERAGANQLLLCGQIDEGVRILRGSLAQIARGAPSSTWSAIFWLIFYSVQLRFIGLRFAELDRSKVPRLLVDQLEGLYAVIASLGLVDVLVGASLTARFMVLAFRGGYRAAVVAATTFAATQLASRGGPISKREIILVRLTKEMYV